METKLLNFGIVGCGMIANFHADAILHIENARLHGVVDANTAQAAAFANKYGVKSYDTFDAMLADDDIDAVCICTPSGFHAQNAIAALGVGKHVVLEKPMALCTQDAQRVMQAARQSGRLLTVVSQLRFGQDVQRVKQLVEQHAFGQIVFCDLYMKYWRDPAYYAGSWKGTKQMDGGGALMNQGIHGVDMLLYMVGDAAVTSANVRTVFHDIEVEDTAVAMLAFENGAVGVVEAATCCYNGFERKIEILGTEGCAVLRENTLEKLVVHGETLIDGTIKQVAGTAADPAALDNTGHRLQIANLVDAVLYDKPLLIDGAEGCRAVALIQEIYEKSKGDAVCSE